MPSTQATARRRAYVLVLLGAGLALAACGQALVAGPASPGDAGAAPVDPSDVATLDAATLDAATLDAATLDAATLDAATLEAGDGDAAFEALCQRPPGDVGVRSDACLARLDLGGKQLPYYSSHSLDVAHGAIESLVLITHGNSRNAWDYYDLVVAAAVARDPRHTAVVAPLFQSYNATCGYDPKAPTDLYWGCSDWKEGLAAKNDPTDSYGALDALLAAAKAAFPSLRRVTVAGYSAGGQTVQRYAAGNREHDRTPTIATRYVVASPGSYMYLDGRRVRADATCSSAAACALTAASFEVPAYAPGCETAEPAVVAGSDAYDAYRYGLEAREGYLAPIPGATLRAQYVARPIVYVLSEGDSAASGARPTAYGALDKGCAAMVQAPLGASFRLQRGLVYHAYVTTLFGATHRRVLVPVCGHEDDCVLGAPATLAELFGP